MEGPEKFTEPNPENVEVANDWEVLKAEAFDRADEALDKWDGRAMDDEPSPAKTEAMLSLCMDLSTPDSSSGAVDNSKRFIVEELARQITEDQEDLKAALEEAAEAERVPFPEKPDYPGTGAEVYPEPVAANDNYAPQRSNAA